MKGLDQYQGLYLFSRLWHWSFFFLFEKNKTAQCIPINSV
jgi:hypothetical protein